MVIVVYNIIILIGKNVLLIFLYSMQTTSQWYVYANSNDITIPPESLRHRFGVIGFYRVLFSVPDVPVPGSRVLGSVRDVFSAFALPLVRGKIAIVSTIVRIYYLT
jgi:hypothetical protein